MTYDKMVCGGVREEPVMYFNSAYLDNLLEDFHDQDRALIVGSCGVYRLSSHPEMSTYRPKGRLDFQLLYIASGTAHFYFTEEDDMAVAAGHMVFYRPKEMQKYIYYGAEKPEVYWVHFTGSDASDMMRHYGIMDDIHVINTGTSLGYTNIFRQMIQELQRRQEDFEELLALLLKQLFISIRRQMLKGDKWKNVFPDNEMENAIQYFNNHYHQEINIKEYAVSKGMSVSWFIRHFKQYTGTTPMQYIVSLRMTNAQVLLETTNYNVTEIGNMIGYDNPLYFSRIFRKQKGISPSEYRKRR